MTNGSDTKEIIRKAMSVLGKRGVIARKKKYGKDWAKIFYSKAPTHLKAKEKKNHQPAQKQLKNYFLCLAPVTAERSYGGCFMAIYCQNKKKKKNASI